MRKGGKKRIKSIHEGIRNLVLRLIDWGITVLSKTELKITEEDNPNPGGYDDLTPTSKGDEDKKYSKILEWALKNKNIKNIALTGPYGSGKSSIIKTFTKEHREYDILNISLASFSDKDIENNKDINRLIELSILQQMFYHVKHRQIPDSRFKRIKNLRLKNVIFKSFLFIIWLIAVLIFFKPDFITSFVLWKSYDLDTNKIVPVVALCISLVGIAYAVAKIFRVANNSKLNKLNVQSGEIELDHNVDSSILNKHLDEILYFFEVTKFDIVIIEDLDRFNNTEIFTKLRELNILVNHSKQINRRVVFLYAIKDDMFQDKNRTKFFDFIIPVIPIINTSNAGEMLLNKFKETELIQEDESRNSLSIDFISDVSMYIDDMRLLKNIHNEYVVYKDKLDPKLNQDNLLAMIIYKNIFPSDFVDLHNDKGKVYSIFNKKTKLIQNRINIINDKIKSSHEKIQQIENINIIDIKELRAIYIEAILEKLPKAISFFVGDKNCSFSDCKNDDNFSILSESISPISYYYHDVMHYNQLYTAQSTSSITFAQIEKSVDSDLTYGEREELLIQRSDNKVESLKQGIEKFEKEKRDIKSWSLFQIAEKTETEDLFKDIEAEKLIIYLIRNGYLNENYHDYISYFYEGLITKDDRDFLFSIKNRDALDFKFKLTKIENLLRKIKSKEFEYKETLNCSLLDYFLVNKTKHNEQYDVFLSQICDKSHPSMLFIDTFLSEGINIDLFIHDLCKRWQSFWHYISTLEYSDEKKNTYLKTILMHIDINEIKKQDVKCSLSNYIAIKSDFIDFVSGMDTEKINTILKELNVKFSNLVKLDYESKVLDFIYKNDLYKINFDMIRLFILTKGGVENENLIETKNYTTIISSGAKPLIKYINENIQIYVSNVFLQLPDNAHESEESILSLLNNDGIKEEDKKKIVDKLESKIQLLSSTQNNDLKEYIVATSKVAATWENIAHFYSLSEENINKTLSDFINKGENYKELSKSKMKDTLGDKNPILSKLSNSIIINEDITDDCFKSVLLCCPYVYTPLDFANLSENKIDLMLKHGYLLLTLERYNYLKENAANNKHIDLLIRNSKAFFESNDDYSFDEKDLLALLSTDRFIPQQKISIVLKSDTDVIKGNTELCNQVCRILANHQYIKLDYDLLFSIIANSQFIEDRIKLLNIYLHSLSESSVTELLNALGKPYSDIVIRGKKPSIPRNSDTQTFVEKLHENNYISSFKEKDDLIRIYTFTQ